MKNVCRVSVHIIVFIPPLLVYIQISKTEVITVISNGIPISSNNISCKTLETNSNLIEAPINLESKKKEAPVL